MNMRLAIVAATVTLSPSLATAQAVSDKPQITLDPAKAYVLYTAMKGGQAVELIRDPNEADVTTYNAARAKALAKAQKKYASQLKTWEQQSDPKRAAPGISAGPKPIAPAATFTFPPIELSTMVPIGPMFRFAKSGDRSVYLQEVIPGTYTVYGPLTVVQPGSAVGSCLCMGTVKFKAEAGVITNMGYMVNTMVEMYRTAKESGVVPPKDAFGLPEGTTSFAIDPKAPGGETDPRIGTYPVKYADYHPAGKRPNWHGAAVDRLTAMPGIFRYERDKIIDLTGAATP